MAETTQKGITNDSLLSQDLRSQDYLNKGISVVYCFVPGVKLASIRMLRALPLKLNDSIILTDEQFLEHLKA